MSAALLPVQRRDDTTQYAFDSVGLTVEESFDAGATWHVAWKLQPRRAGYLRRGSAARGTYVDLGPRDIGQIVVRALPSGAHVVVVTNGLDGLVVGDPTGWRRAGLPEFPQLPQPSPGRQFGSHVEAELGAALLVALLTWMVTCRVGSALRLGRRGDRAQG